ncbi:MAG: metal-dependent hydrolase [Rhodocyclaceae bacterium]|nr:metal-dependent hydrolase [Rhodocyclaceae bacterium]
MTDARMTLRAMPFVFEPSNKHWNPGHWNTARPEFSQVVNSASLAMPFLEPYLIRSMRAARSKITDPALLADLDLYIRQEAAHYKQHQLFNETLRAAGYTCIDAIESRLAADYSKLEKERSLRFNLAYAEGFEAMALAIGQMLIEDRVHLFGDSKPAVASLVLWHFVEEIEHKSVAYDVLHHLHPGYFLRIGGLIYATAHIFWRTRQGYHRLLKEDGLSRSLASHWALTKVIYRVLFNILPKWLRILRPGYHPRQIADPAWGLAWAKLFRDNPAGAAKLDTARLAEPVPVPS